MTPMAMPAQRPRIGSPDMASARLAAHTVAMDEEPSDSNTSAVIRAVNGKFLLDGKILSTARRAR